MTVHEIVTMLTRLPHDAVVLVDNNGDFLEPIRISVEMSPDLYEQHDHVIFECEQN